MANIFRVTITQLNQGQQIQNVLHFTGPSSDPLQLPALAQEVETNWVQNVRVSQWGSLKYIDIGVRLLESQFATFHRTLNLLATGGVGSDQFIPFAAYIYQLRGATIGPRSRGRVYIAGVHQDDTAQGLLSAAAVSTRRARQETILGVFGPNGTSTFRLVICPSKPPFNVVPVTSMSISPTLGTQRRRNIGRGM